MTITRYHFNSFNLGCHFDHGNEFQSMPTTIVEMVKASEYDVLAARVAELEKALHKIAEYEGERNEWDAVDRVMPAMRDIASAALADGEKAAAELWFCVKCQDRYIGHKDECPTCNPPTTSEK